MKLAHKQSPATEALLWTGLVLVLAPLLTRASTLMNPFPAWDVDPLSAGGIDSGLSPFGSLIIDALVVLGSACLFLHARAMRVAPSRSCLLLAAIGAVPVVLHALVFGEARGSIGNAYIGFAWLSAILAGVSVFHAASDVRARRAIIALLGGFIVVLAIRGCAEFFIEFPRRLASFQGDKVRILASHGWMEGSSMALAFERRLVQPEASGWFGLSNIYASLAAAGTTLGLGLVVATFALRRTRPVNWRLWLPASMVMIGGAASLYFSQSKGGVIACAAGVLALLTLAGIRTLLTRTLLDTPRARRIAGLIGIGAVVGALALIAVRMIIGERLGELSLLFRGYYAEAALRMFARNPLWGVGPDGFQEAYALTKNPLSPEEPTSPHIIVLDYLSTLGVLGLAWVGLVLRAAWSAGAASVRTATLMVDDQRSRDENSRAEFRTLVFLPSLVTLGAVFLQGILITPDAAVLRVVSLMLWSATAWALSRALKLGLCPNVALGAGALALLAHAQIDLAGSWVQSCGLLAVWCACAAAPLNARLKEHDPRPSSMLLAGALGAVVLSLCVLAGGLRAWRWERHLVAARDQLLPVIEVVNRVALLREQTAPGATTPPKESFSAIASDVARAVGEAPAQDDRTFDRHMRKLEVALIPRAVDELLLADAADRSDFRARREASRLLTRRAEHLLVLGQTEEARASLARAGSVLVTGRARSSEHFALFLVHERAAQLLKDDAERTLAARSLDNAIAGEPLNLEFAVRRFKLAAAAQDPRLAEYARRCLRLDAYMVHDRAVRGLSDVDRAQIEAAAR